MSKKNETALASPLKVSEKDQLFVAIAALACSAFIFLMVFALGSPMLDDPRFAESHMDILLDDRLSAGCAVLIGIYGVSLLCRHFGRKAKYAEIALALACTLFGVLCARHALGDLHIPGVVRGELPMFALHFARTFFVVLTEINPASPLL